MQVRSDFRRATAIERNSFLKEIGKHSKKISICHRELSTEVELAFHLSTIYTIVGEDEFHLETNDLVGVDPNHEALTVLLRVVGRRNIVPYRKMIDFYDRAEFLYLRLVSLLDDVDLARLFHLAKNVVCLYRSDGTPFPTVKYTMDVGGKDKVIPDYPKDVYIPGNEKSNVDTLVRNLKILHKKMSACRYMHGNSGLINGYIDKNTVNVYYFVEMLKTLPEGVMPVLHNFNGNIAILSCILGAQGLILYYVDSAEKPKYVNSTRSYFGTSLLLYNGEVKNPCHINYQVPAFRTLYTQIDAQMKEFCESQAKSNYSVFRCDRMFASAYKFGYPDYSSMSTVWVTNDIKASMVDAVRMMLGFFSMVVHYSAYLMDDKLKKMKFLPIDFSKPAEIPDEEDAYQAFKMDLREIVKKDKEVNEIPEEIPKRILKRGTKAVKSKSEYEDDDEVVDDGKPNAAGEGEQTNFVDNTPDMPDQSGQNTGYYEEPRIQQQQNKRYDEPQSYQNSNNAPKYRDPPIFTNARVNENVYTSRPSNSKNIDPTRTKREVREKFSNDSSQEDQESLMSSFKFG